MSTTALQFAIERKGGIVPFSKMLDVTPNTVRYWLGKPRRRPPGPAAEYVLRIERETGVSRHELRPDIYPREDAA